MRSWFLLFAISGMASAGEYVVEAPSGKYSIVQRYIEPSDPQGNSEFGAWEAALHFSDKSKPDATLAAAPDRYTWPAEYCISPDERWILRLQKTGSGENSALLYRVEPNGQVWRLEQHLDDLAFAVATARTHLTRADYYHVEVALVSWDIASGRLHLAIRGVAEERANPAIEQKVIYDLRKNKMLAE